MKSYYKFKDFLLNMESKTNGKSKTCGKYKQHVLKKGLPTYELQQRHLLLPSESFSFERSKMLP